MIRSNDSPHDREVLEENIQEIMNKLIVPHSIREVYDNFIIRGTGLVGTNIKLAILLRKFVFKLCVR